MGASGVEEEEERVVEVGGEDGLAEAEGGRVASSVR